MNIYEATERDFDSWGLGSLPDVLYGTVTEHRNEKCEITFTYPAGGRNADLIIPGRIVTTTANDSDQAQPFCITDVQRESPDKITAYGEHLALWLLSGVVVPPMVANNQTASQIISAIHAACLNGAWVSMSTDITTSGSYQTTIPKTALKSLVGSEGSFVDLFGGILHFDGLSVKVEANRGADRAVAARYGSNLVAISFEANMSRYASAIYPFFANDTTKVYLPEGTIGLTSDSEKPKKVALIDFSSEFENPPTSAQLRAAAQKYAKNNLVQNPEVTISAEFIPLWDTREYSGKIPKQKISIGDTITIVHPPLNLAEKSTVVGLDWDIVANRYSAIYTGKIRRTIIDTIYDLQRRTP